MTVFFFDLCFCLKIYLDFGYIMIFGCISEIVNDLIYQQGLLYKARPKYFECYLKCFFRRKGNNFSICMRVLGSAYSVTFDSKNVLFSFINCIPN